MSVSSSDLIDLYLAYFGRPPDPGGLAYYLGDPSLDDWAVAARFAASPEEHDLFQGKTLAGEIDAIYSDAFGRFAEPGGLMYWSGEVASGRLSLAQLPFAIYLGAQNQDVAALHDRTLFCTSFLANLDTPGVVEEYSGADAAARARSVVFDNPFYDHDVVRTPEAWQDIMDQLVGYVCGANPYPPTDAELVGTHHEPAAAGPWLLAP
jgi:hypothetical protein